MEDSPVITGETEPSVEPLAVECKFTVESVGGNALGGLAEGGSRRIEFEGYATRDVMHELAGAIRRVSKS